jgi:hypothetical protein
VIDLDRASLDRIRPSTPGPADWDDVMSRSQVRERRRHRRLVVLAAVMLMAVATACAFGARALILDEGFVGVPPDGATPSTPESGELVLHYIGRPAATEGRRFQAFLYADGRLIWDLADLAGPKYRTGFLEQRLTPEGVELLLSEFISTGLFDRDIKLVSKGDSGWALIQVRNGNRLVNVDWAGATGPGGDYLEATPEQESAIERLGALLVDPGSGLPASAWENREVRAYVASRYEVCVSRINSAYSNLQSLELSELLTGLPTAAADLLREAEWTVDEATAVDWRFDSYCSDIATEKAQAIAKALDAAGIARVDPASRVQAYWFDYREARPVQDAGWIPRRATIGFATYLPHGEIVEPGGG